VDFERAIRIASSGQVDLQPLVTDVLALGDAGKGFEQMKQGGDVLKVLLDCQRAVGLPDLVDNELSVLYL